MELKYFSTKELSIILSMSVPAVTVYVSIMFMQLCTMFFAGTIGLRELSIFGLASSFFNVCFLFCVGLNVAGGVVCGEHYGERDDKRVTQAGVQSIWVALLAGVLCIAMVPAIPYILTASDQDPSITQEVLDTTVIIILALPFLSVFSAVRSFLTSITHPYILLKIMPPAVLFNGVLLFVFTEVFKMGLTGVAYAFVINNVMLCAWSIIICHINHYSRSYRIFHPSNMFQTNWKMVSRLLKIGIPSGFAILTESVTLQVLLLMAGSLGIASLNACQIGAQVSALCIMISVGVGQVTMARISNAVGAKEYHKVALLSGSSIAALSVLVLAFALIIIWFREEIALTFLSKTDQELFQQTLHLTVQILFLTAFTQIVDSGQTICAYCMRGLRDTRIPMYIIIGCYWLGGIVPAYLLGFVFHAGIVGAWIGFTFGILLTNLFLGIRTWNIIRRYSKANPLPLILSHKAT